MSNDSEGASLGLRAQTAATTINEPLHSQIGKILFAPYMAPLLQSRGVALLLASIAALQVGLTAAELPAWPCPFKAVLGVPCPTCGLTRAIILLMEGEWRAALSTHAFAPVLLLGVIVMAVVGALPGSLHRAAIRRVAVLERHTGAIVFLSLGLAAYWWLRSIGWL